jgi:Molybdopterin-binding domain of aldehyde dehydrogenase
VCALSTDEVAIGRGTYASRRMMVGGSALRAAADEVIERGKRFAAHFMEADAADIAFADGNFTISGTDRAMGIEQVAQMSFIPMGLPAELADLARFLREAIEADRYPLSPRVRRLKALLAKIDPAPAPAATPLPPPKPPGRPSLVLAKKRRR